MLWEGAQSRFPQESVGSTYQYPYGNGIVKAQSVFLFTRHWWDDLWMGSVKNADSAFNPCCMCERSNQSWQCRLRLNPFTCQAGIKNHQSVSSAVNVRHAVSFGASKTGVNRKDKRDGAVVGMRIVSSTGSFANGNLTTPAPS